MSISADTLSVTAGPGPGAVADCPNVPPGQAHLVHFYENEEVLASAVARFVGDGLSAGDVVITIASREHTNAIDRHLHAAAVDLDAARASGRLLSLDADETLTRFMRDDEPDPRMFEKVIGGVIADQVAAANGTRVRAYGEMVDILWKRGDQSAALHLEELWNALQGRQPFTLLCAYAMASFYKQPATIHNVCATHTQVVRHQGDSEQPGTPVVGTETAPDYPQVLAREVLHREEVELALRASLRQLRAREEELRQREEQLRDFFENGTVALHRVGADGRILWANRAELDLLGYTAEEYIGRPIAEFHEDQGLIGDILARLVRGDALHDVEARLRAKDGATKHVLISSSGYFRDGKFVHSRCFTRDISERRKAEQALRDSQRQLQLITDALPVCISYIDRDDSVPVRERRLRTVVRQVKARVDRATCKRRHWRRRIRDTWPIHTPRARRRLGYLRRRGAVPGWSDTVCRSDVHPSAGKRRRGCRRRRADFRRFGAESVRPLPRGRG